MTLGLHSHLQFANFIRKLSDTQLIGIKVKLERTESKWKGSRDVRKIVDRISRNLSRRD